MKKVYKEFRYKSYSRRKENRAAKAQEKAVRLRKARAQKRRRRHPVQEEHRRKTIHAPSSFSLVDNPRETHAFFAEMHGLIEKGIPLNIDVSDVTQLCPDALLYTVATFDHYKQLGQSYKIRGNQPRNRVCKQLFEQSGFYEYLSVAPYVPKQASNILTIERHSQVYGALASNLLRFCKENLPGADSMVSKRNYRAILEMMGNTCEHAYHKHKLRWYMMAVYFPEEKAIRVAFLDNGLGIAATVHKNFPEQIREWFGIQKLKPSQSALILSALEGKLRTRTQDGFRGKGLPAIFQCYQEGTMRDLVIVSKRARLDFRNGQFRDHRHTFNGTLFGWTIKEG